MAVGLVWAASKRTVARPRARFTSHSCTPGTARAALVTCATQVAQSMPVTAMAVSAGEVASVVVVMASSQKSTERQAHLLHQFLVGSLAGFGVGGGAVAADAAGDAVFHVVGEQLDTHGVERGAHGRHLREDVDAVAVVIDHLLQPGDLPG